MLRNAVRHLCRAVVSNAVKATESRWAGVTSAADALLQRPALQKSVFVPYPGVRRLYSMRVSVVRRTREDFDVPQSSEESLSEEDYEAIFGMEDEDENTMVDEKEADEEEEEQEEDANAIEFDEEFDDDDSLTEGEDDNEVEDSDWFVDKEFENAPEIFQDISSARPSDPEAIAADEALVAAAYQSPTSLIDAPSAAAFLRLERAKSVHLMDVSEVCSWCKYFVFAEVASERQMEALGWSLRKKIKSLSGSRVPPVTGGLKEGGGWISFDAGDVVIHMLTTKAFAEYDLVNLWEERLQANREEPQIPSSPQLPDSVPDVADD